jgi:hypothetical protein
MSTDAQVLYHSIEALVRAQHQTFLTNVINQLHLLTIFVSLLPDGSLRSLLLELRSHLTMVLMTFQADQPAEFTQGAPPVYLGQPAHPGET